MEYKIGDHVFVNLDLYPIKIVCNIAEDNIKKRYYEDSYYDNDKNSEYKVDIVAATILCKHKQPLDDDDINNYLKNERMKLLNFFNNKIVDTCIINQYNICKTYNNITKMDHIFYCIHLNEMEEFGSDINNFRMLSEINHGCILAAINY
jgi:hypothetical protein